MWKKITDSLKKASGKRPAFDPSTIDDPLAGRTAWTPAKSGGANFRTHRLVEIHGDRLEFRATTGALVFFLVFIVIGAGILIAYPIYGSYSGGISLSKDMVVVPLLGIVFLLTGGVLIYQGTVPVVFDKHKGFFWKGRTAPHEVVYAESLKNCARLEDIHALQIISEHCRSDKSSYYSYELNLVLKDGARLNVIDHGNRKTIRENTATLSEFLGTPVWDAA